ncbi:MAG: hypothetical protein HYZ30_00260 [Candidatus Azosocius agrarius]|nr:MAG: hypothetical protein HYZ30_00260 [Gammaproteobacteria bacterium]
MFEIGIWELILTLLITIIILNPNDYYKLFYTFGKFINNLTYHKQLLQNDFSESLKNNEKKIVNNEKNEKI